MPSSGHSSLPKAGTAASVTSRPASLAPVQPMSAPSPSAPGAPGTEAAPAVVEYSRVPLPTPQATEEQRAEETRLRDMIEEKLVSREYLEEQREQLLDNVDEAADRLRYLASTDLPSDVRKEIAGTIQWLGDVRGAAAEEPRSLEDLQIRAQAVHARLAETQEVLTTALRSPQDPPPTPNRLLAAADRIFLALPEVFALLQEEGIAVPAGSIMSFNTAQTLYGAIREQCLADEDACARIGETVPHLEQVLGTLKDTLKKAKREDLVLKMQQMMTP